METRCQMGTREEQRRMAVKTPQQHLQAVLEQEFHYPPRVAEAIVAEAQNCLYGDPLGVRPGQLRVILTRRGSRAGQALRDTRQVEVIWTVDAGEEDREVQAKHGSQALRRVRIQRLLDEAVEQGGVATQEDLAQVLHSSVRTIKRDFAILQQQGQLLNSRGALDGMGRGQTHKAQIIQRWLRGETFDQLSARTHHSPKSIQRYLRSFVQVVSLHKAGYVPGEIARLLQIGLALVEDYLAIHAQHQSPAECQRLNEQIQRFQQLPKAKKGAK